MAETPVITPSRLLLLDGVGSKDNQCTVAVVGFCPFREMKKKARARLLNRSLFVHVDPTHQFQGVIDGREVLMVECVYGGPVTATVIEEMAYLGVKYVFGYGYSGSLRKEITPGDIVLAKSGIISDCTSREYSERFYVGGGEWTQKFSNIGLFRRLLQDVVLKLITFIE